MIIGGWTRPAATLVVMSGTSARLPRIDALTQGRRHQAEERLRADPRVMEEIAEAVEICSLSEVVTLKAVVRLEQGPEGRRRRPNRWRVTWNGCARRNGACPIRGDIGE